jgi:hypothetical protein
MKSTIRNSPCGTTCSIFLIILRLYLSFVFGDISRCSAFLYDGADSVRDLDRISQFGMTSLLISHPMTMPFLADLEDASISHLAN